VGAVALDGPVMLALAAVAVPFFGLIALWAIYRLVVPHPLVVVDAQGIRDTSLLLAAGLVRWDEIARVYVGGVGRQRFLCVVPADPEAFLRRQAPFKRRLMRANIGLVGAPVNIAQVALPLPIEEIIAAMRAYSPPSSADGALVERQT